MPKRAAQINQPEISLDQHATMPLYKQLYERLRAMILAGQLEVGARLPSTRALASELGISRNTTALAYELLLLEGYIESRVGDGTRIAKLQPEQLQQGSRRSTNPSRTEHSDQHVALLSRRSQTLINSPALDILSSEPGQAGSSVFRVGQPDVTYFPYEKWAALLARNARQLLQDYASYQNAQGYGPLREAIAAHIGVTRGVHCSPEQIVMTAGAQGALDLIARVLLNPGDPVWVEDPGYQGAYGALLSNDAKMIEIPVDGEGLNVEVGRHLCPEARLAIVTPSHQLPTGVTMSLNRRLALLEWAREAQSWIVEDDYDSEYRFSGRPLESLQGLDSTNRVIYIGTFSKVLFPSLRLGYLVAPPELLKGFIATRRLIDTHLPLLEQMALADFMGEGHFVRHLRKMRSLYLERRNALIEALRQEFGDNVNITIPEAGMHLLAWLPSGVNVQMATRQIEASGLHIQLISESRLWAHPRTGLMLGFAGASPEELRKGVKCLAQALQGL
ncbi:MAG TPA: PLP-dependent aminotransferase family protein [Ktedonobacteraceae bacterium]|nr:PLP-dependent aminotransferase family protein [Ktedonobacteraceae bacterium]